MRKTESLNLLCALLLGCHGGSSATAQDRSEDHASTDADAPFASSDPATGAPAANDAATNGLATGGDTSRGELDEDDASADADAPFASGDAATGGAVTNDAAANGQATGGDTSRGELDAASTEDATMVEAVDPYADLPVFDLELIREVPLDIDPALGDVEPQGLFASDDRLYIVTESSQFRFLLDGQFLAESGESGFGIDGVDDDRLVTAEGNAVVWLDIERSVDLLESERHASGIAFVPPTGYVVTDASHQAAFAYAGFGDLQAELALPGTQLQGVALADEDTLYVVDAASKRLLLLAPTLEEPLAVANLPEAVQSHTPTGLSYRDEELYVCFSDALTVAVMNISGLP